MKEMYAKADELFISSRQVPKKIIVQDWCILFAFPSQSFLRKKDCEARNKFFQWVIDNSKEII